MKMALTIKHLVSYRAQLWGSSSLPHPWIHFSSPTEGKLPRNVPAPFLDIFLIGKTHSGTKGPSHRVHLRVCFTAESTN